MRDRPGLRSICVDCQHPAQLARFWADALGWSVRPYRPGELEALARRGLTQDTDPSICVDPPDERLPTLWFNQVPEPKVGKVRIHLDVNVADAGGIDRLVAAGARILRRSPGGNPWTIMADPEGHEFDVFVIGGGR